MTTAAARRLGLRRAAPLGLAVALLAFAALLVLRSSRTLPDVGIRTETERRLFGAVTEYAGPRAIGIPVRLVEASVSEETATARCVVEGADHETRDLTFELARNAWSGVWYVRSHRER